MFRLILIRLYLWMQRVTRKKEEPVATWHQDRYMKFTVDKDVDIPAVLRKMGIPDPHDGENARKEDSFETNSTVEKASDE